MTGHVHVHDCRQSKGGKQDFVNAAWRYGGGLAKEKGTTLIGIDLSSTLLPVGPRFPSSNANTVILTGRNIGLGQQGAGGSA